MCGPVPDRLIVVTQEPFSRDDLESRLGGEVRGEIVGDLRSNLGLAALPQEDLDRLPFDAYCVKVEGDPVRAISHLSLDGQIARAEPDVDVYASGALGNAGVSISWNDSLLQDYLDMIVPKGHGSGGAGITVAVIDSGIEPTSNQAFNEQFNFVRGSASISTNKDSLGHGTAMAALIRLVAPAVEIHSYRVFGDDGRASLFDVLSALVAASIPRTISVVSASLRVGTLPSNCRNCGYPGPAAGSQIGQSLDIARLQLERRDSCPVLVGAAGNDEPYLSFPALLSTCLPVGSVNSKFEKSSFFSTNMGSRQFIVGPGGDKRSADKSGKYLPGDSSSDESLGEVFKDGVKVGDVRGTSVATAFVSGVIALYLADGVNGGAIDSLARHAFQPSNYIPAVHGHGVVRYEP